MEGRKTCSLKSCGIFHSMKISGSNWLSLFLKPIKQVLKSESLSPGFALQSTYECTTLSLQAVPHTTSSHASRHTDLLAEAPCLAFFASTWGQVF